MKPKLPRTYERAMQLELELEYKREGEGEYNFVGLVKSYKNKGKCFIIFGKAIALWEVSLMPSWLRGFAEA